MSKVKDPEVHPAIELLLARMESNPEEFINGHKWGELISNYRKNFTEKEKELFFIKERELSMECFHQEIMRQILSDKPEDSGVVMSLNPPYLTRAYAAKAKRNGPNERV